VSIKGCADTTSKPFRVEAIPIANMNFNNGCVAQNVSFLDQSSVSFGNINKWHWSLGNGDTSIQQNFNYGYPAANNYVVSPFVETVNGCTSPPVSRSINIESIPQVLFNNSNACIGKEVQFQNESTISFGTIKSYNWQFGNGNTSTDINPIATFSKTGNYIVQLTATSVNGCSGGYSKQFNIAPMNVSAGNDTIAATGLPIQLHASGGKYYEWEPPDFLNNPTSDHPVATLERDQAYHVKVTDAEGCTAYDDVKIRVIKGPNIYVPNAFTPNGNANRIFRPILVGIRELNYFSIYNRWGQLLYQTNEDGKGWDGRAGGKQQPEGTYVWMVGAKDLQGNLILRKGVVVLIR
jgi:gliding motility-associated-like protein